MVSLSLAWVMTTLIKKNDRYAVNVDVSMFYVTGCIDFMIVLVASVASHLN